MSLGWYAYGVISSEELTEPPMVEGIDPSHPVLLSGSGNIRAVVSEVEISNFEGPALQENINKEGWLEAQVRAHERVLDTLVPLTTVVPMRFGSIFSSEGSLQQMLEESADALTECLDRVRGRVEWGVKVYKNADERIEVPSGPASGRDYLLRRSAEMRAAQEAIEAAGSAAQEIYEELSKSSDGAVLVTSSRERDASIVLNAAYLISESRRDEFMERAHRVQEAHAGFVLEVTGPWPAYNFTKVDVAGVGS
jgi:hypothetical protein